MRIAYFDCSSGICGSMIVGAFLDAGLPIETLRQKLDLLGIEGLSISVSRVLRRSFSGSLFRVHEGPGDRPVDLIELPEDAEALLVKPATAGRRKIQRMEPGHAHRRLADIESILRSSSLDPEITEECLRIFLRLAEAEAKIHGVTVSDIHFHEVGALDAIGDIVCAVLARRMLGLEKICSSPVAVGNGTVRCQHGVLSVPAPATIELLKGIPLKSHEAQMELTTPTGAAILAEWTTEFGDMPAMVVERIGYGAGEMNPPHPNLLRVLIGDSKAEVDRFERDSVVQIESNLDDMNPEDLPPALQRILDAGALDVAHVPMLMKKGRFGLQLVAICEADRLRDVGEAIFQHTPAIGLRYFQVSRLKLPRTEVAVPTSFGNVSGKQVERLPGAFTFKPDADVCQKLALERGASIQAVRLAAQVSWSALAEGGDG